MQLAAFVRKNRERWERFETLLNALEQQQVRRMDRASLRELSHLYRACTSDLAFAQTYFQGTTLLLFLHQLVGRAHHQIYRTGGFSLPRMAAFLRYEVPAVARRHLYYFAFSGMLFLGSFVLGVMATHASEKVAWLVVPPEVLESIYAGKLWTRGIFSATPGSVMSAAIFSNNVTVALLAFSGGMTFGVYTALILLGNGFMLGVITQLCAAHGLLPLLFEFVAGHGFLELSAIVTAGAAGFIVAGALLNPGDYRRVDALAIRGKAALTLVVGCALPLLGAGLIEGFLSPAENVPTWLRMTLGLSVTTAFWFYLFLGGRKK